MIYKLKSQFRGDNLKARCMRGSFFLGIGNVTEKVLAFASKIILANLLMPQELGLIVLIVSITAFFEVLTEVGIKQSVIQNKKGATPEYLNMAWWFQSVRALCLYMVAYIATPWMCGFYFKDKPQILAQYDWPTLYLMVRLAFLSILFNGFISPRAHVLEKEFRFGKTIMIIQGSAFVGIILTIFLTFALRNAWAMVLGFVCQAGLRVVFSYLFCPFLPRIKYGRESFGELLRFARGMFGSPILTYIAYNIDVLVGGRLVPAELLGMYGFAIILARTPRELFGRIINPILLPAFAEKQYDNSALRKAVLKLTSITVMIGLPLVVFANIFSGTILSLIFGSEFEEVAVAFGLFCLNVLLIVQGMIFANLIIALGWPAKLRLCVGLRALLLVLFIYPAIKSYGMAGAAGLLAAANLLTLGSQILMVRKQIGLQLFDYLSVWKGGVVCSVAMFTLILSFQLLLPGEGIVHLIFRAAVCGIVILAGLKWQAISTVFCRRGNAHTDLGKERNA